MFVYIMLFLLLSKRNISLCYALSIMYTLSKLYGLLLVKRFVSVHKCFRIILILGRTRLKSLKELERAYSNALIM